MFTTCPKCRADNPAKTIDPAGPWAICPACGHPHRFVMLPHFVVTGPSSAGKTTVALGLPGRLKECVVLDRDVWWRKEFDGSAFFEFSLQLAKNVSQAGRPVVQCGALLPENLEPCVERRYFSAIHYLALVCDDAVLEQRLRVRFASKGDKLAEYVAYHLDFNRYLKANAATLRPVVALLDTTDQAEEATLVAVRDWVRGILRGREGKYIDAEGVIVSWPPKEGDKRRVLEYLATKFAPGTDYAEKDVNAVINAHHCFDDYALLRRELVDRGLLDRVPDGSRYWRPATG